MRVDSPLFLVTGDKSHDLIHVRHRDRIASMCGQNLQSDLRHCFNTRGTASTSNIEILERFQSKALRLTVDAPWHLPNDLPARFIVWLPYLQF
jgi:hypothetical protein